MSIVRNAASVFGRGWSASRIVQGAWGAVCPGRSSDESIPQTTLAQSGLPGVECAGLGTEVSWPDSAASCGSNEVWGGAIGSSGPADTKRDSVWFPAGGAGGKSSDGRSISAVESGAPRDPGRTTRDGVENGAGPGLRREPEVDQHEPGGVSAAGPTPGPRKDWDAFGG